MSRIIVEIEWEDSDRCTRKDIDEAIDHLRFDHGAIVREESPNSLFEHAFEAMEKIRRIRAIVGT